MQLFPGPTPEESLSVLSIQLLYKCSYKDRKLFAVGKKKYYDTVIFNAIF